jgi:putative phosphoribosyl transferase
VSRRFHDRLEAGRALAAELARVVQERDALVLALPRGGVPVAWEVARARDWPLDVIVVRKVGMPGQPELAMGAVASGGARVRNDDIVSLLSDGEAVFDGAAARELDEVARRERAYRGERPPLSVSGRTCIVVDDGIATGATMAVAVQALRSLGARRIVAAAPVTSRSARERLEACADAVVCISEPAWFHSVGQWYEDFEQTSDEEVSRLLLASSTPGRAPGTPC